jgi:hypothetical protein
MAITTRRPSHYKINNVQQYGDLAIRCAPNNNNQQVDALDCSPFLYQVTFLVQDLEIGWSSVCYSHVILYCENRAQEREYDLWRDPKQPWKPRVVFSEWLNPRKKAAETRALGERPKKG